MLLDARPIVWFKEENLFSALLRLCLKNEFKEEQTACRIKILRQPAKAVRLECLRHAFILESILNRAWPSCDKVNMDAFQAGVFASGISRTHGWDDGSNKWRIPNKAVKVSRRIRICSVSEEKIYLMHSADKISNLIPHKRRHAEVFIKQESDFESFASKAVAQMNICGNSPEERELHLKLWRCLIQRFLISRHLYYMVVSSHVPILDMQFLFSVIHIFLSYKVNFSFANFWNEIFEHVSKKIILWLLTSCLCSLPKFILDLSYALRDNKHWVEISSGLQFRHPLLWQFSPDTSSWNSYSNFLSRERILEWEFIFCDFCLKGQRCNSSLRVHSNWQSIC